MLAKWPKTSSTSHYIIEKTIGQGTFGKVKLASHKYTKEKVAVKIIEKVKIPNAKDNLRIAREISILRLLKSQYTLKLYEVIETRQEIWIICEYLPDGELYNYIVKSIRVSESESLFFFQQLIFGIEYLHSLGITHRDIKPENLFLQKSHLKIGDFGLSCKNAPGELLKTACGSPCFAAPEMIQGKKYQGHISDIWSCGVVLYSLLCGYLPFEDENMAKLFQKISNADYKFPSFLKGPAKELIQKMLEVDVGKRINVSEIKKDPWFCKGNFTSELNENEKVSEEVLRELEKVGLSKNDVKESLKNGNDHISTCYFLMKKQWEKKMIRKGKTLRKPRRLLSSRSSAYTNPASPLRSLSKTPIVPLKKHNSQGPFQKSPQNSLIQPPLLTGPYNVNLLSLKPLLSLKSILSSVLANSNSAYLCKFFQYSCKSNQISYTLSISRLKSTLPIYHISVSSSCPQSIIDQIIAVL